MSRTAWSRARRYTAIAAISVGATAGVGLFTVSALPEASSRAAVEAVAPMYQGPKSVAEAERTSPNSEGNLKMGVLLIDGGKDGHV
jgi:hypothetical protein